jgi:hypothetical protein
MHAAEAAKVEPAALLQPPPTPVVVGYSFADASPPRSWNHPLPFAVF